MSKHDILSFFYKDIIYETFEKKTHHIYRTNESYKYENNIFIFYYFFP